MEYIRRNSDYALRGLAYMAGFPISKRFTVNEIASQQRVPEFFLRKILQKLSKQKILGSERGINGGFYLSVLPKKINVLKILEILQGPVLLSKCIINIDKCGTSKYCKIRKKLAKIQKELERLLSKTTLADLA